MADERGAAPDPSLRASWGLAEALVATALASFIVRVLGAQGGWPSSLAPAAWVYVPLLFLALRRRLSFDALGWTAGPWRSALRWLAVATASLLLPCAVALFAHRQASGSSAPPVDAGLIALRALEGLVVIALPEELFFRGYVHARLRAWAGSCGLKPALFATVAGAALFAMAHLAVEPGWLRAAVFFPGLAMGWLRERSGGLIAPVGFHWLANLLWMGLGPVGVE
jgi:hypothetical protein